MQNIIIASGPVIVDDGRVLLNKHGDTSFWKFCGGRVEESDVNLFEAACREAKEEIGVHLKLVDPIPFFFYTQKEVDGEPVDVILVHFLAEKFGRIERGEGIREVAWHDLNDLPKDLAPNIIPALKHFGFIE